MCVCVLEKGLFSVNLTSAYKRHIHVFFDKTNMAVVGYFKFHIQYI